jgi:hypothetical protein
MIARSMVASFILLLAASVVMAADKDDPKDSFIKLTAKGTLKTGIAAIGGETTGIVLQTKDGALELDIKDKDLLKKADTLNGKVVTVTGNFAIKPGVEVKVRYIVSVDSLKGDGDK